MSTPSGLPALRWLVGGALVAASVLVAGCSSGDDSDAASATSPDPVVEGSLAPEEDEPAAGPDAPEQASNDLVGSAWRLVEIDRDGEVEATTGSPVPPAVITFEDATVLGVYDGVNIATGTYELSGEAMSLTLDPPGDIAYPDDDEPQFELIDLLADVERLVVQDRELVLELADGVTLRFVAVAGGVPGG